MLNFLTTLESALVAQAFMLGSGLPVFFILLISDGLPFCSWFEWVDRPAGSGNPEP